MNSKILISVDAIIHSPRKLTKAFKSIFSFAKQASCSTEIASVMSPESIAWPTHFEETWSDEFIKLAQKVANRNIGRIADQCTEHPRLILQRLHSRRQTVRAVVECAQKYDSNFIFAITHLANKPKSFIFPGSFVETLISFSSIPVVTINAEADSIKKYSSILFPTDLSDQCNKSFEKIVELAKVLSARVVLLHVMTIPQDTILITSAGIAGGWPHVETYLQSLEEQTKESASRLLEIAKVAAVDAVFIKLRNNAALSQVILAQARKLNVQLIAMTNQSGPLASVFLGSVTRQVMKGSKIPVLIYPILSNKV